MELGIAQQEGTDPFWYCEIDPLDALFLGSAWPGKFHDEFEFANARDAWLRLLQGTVHGQGIRTFVHEVVATSRELGLPVDDGQLMLAVADRLEAAGLDRRRLPLRLLPGQALEEHRAVRGPAPDLRFPEPPEDAQERVERFWQRSPEDSWEETPLAVLRSGLHRLQDAGLPVEQESCMLLSALYRALLAKPGEPLESLPEHAMAWAFSLDETSTLLPVVDLLAIAPIQGLSTDEVLGRLFAIPAFTETIPSAALLWTSSPGLALPRLAFELGVSEVSTLAAELTPDMLDWVGMHTRMRLNVAAHEGANEAENTADDESAEDLAVRRAAVRSTVLDKIRKKSDGAASSQREPDRPVERIWNADGSSLVRIPTDTAQGQEMRKAVEGQRKAFQEKFGREPGPDDPLFFDPDADEPTPITREYFDNVLLEMADHAAEKGLDPAPLHAWREVGYVVTAETRGMFTTAEVLAFNRAVARYQQDEQ